VLHGRYQACQFINVLENCGSDMNIIVPELYVYNVYQIPKYVNEYYIPQLDSY